MARKHSTADAARHGSGAGTAEQWYAQFTVQAQEERAAGASADNDPDDLIQAARAVAVSVRGDEALTAALEKEEIGEAFLAALTRRADELFALRSQAPSRLSAWALLSPADKQLVADVGTWLRNRVERVHGAARALRKPEAAERFGRPSRVGASPAALLGSIRDFRLAAKEQPALCQRARLKPDDFAQLDTFEADLQRVLEHKTGTRSDHGELKEQLRLGALALEDQLLDYRVRAMAALEVRPNLLKKALESLPRAPERRGKKKVEPQDGEGGDAPPRSPTPGGGASGSNSTSGGTAPSA